MLYVHYESPVVLLCIIPTLVHRLQNGYYVEGHHCTITEGKEGFGGPTQAIKEHMTFTLNNH